MGWLAPTGAVVVDTGVFSAPLRSRTSPLEERYRQHLVGRALVVAQATVEELYYGAEHGGWGAARRDLLAVLLDTADIAPWDDGAARLIGRLRVACLRVGHPLHANEHGNDLRVAATAVYYGLPLVAHDRIFRSVPRLELVTELPA